jgi:ABC-2 type transport system ATP-binding protein
MLEIHNLTKSYGKRVVLQNLNLEVKAGEIYGLLGPNGAGKTTTINIICNLLKADSGIVKINQKSVSKATKAWIGVAPQQNLLYQNLTCAENLEFYGQIYGLSGQKCQKQIVASLEAVSLLERANSTVHTLSGGMQRRLNIAVALVHQPKLLILDEPTTGLDIEARYVIWELIENLRRQGMTILLTTHLLDEAEHLCQCIGILKEGKIIVQGSLAELKSKIPAQEIILIETDTEDQAIARAQELGLTNRYYGNQLAFWLPEHLELSEIINLFEGISFNSLTRKSIQLEHIYLEILKQG